MESQFNVAVALSRATQGMTSISASQFLTVPPPAGCNRDVLHNTKALSACHEMQPDASFIWTRCSYGCGSLKLDLKHCGGHGVCFFGKCYCEPGYGGPACTKAMPPLPSTVTSKCRALGPRTDKYRDHADACLQHPAYGAAVIPAARWQAAQAAEARLWNGASRPSFKFDVTKPPGHADMIKAFDNYRALPIGGSLGRIAEVGSGPWTQTNSLLLFRPDLSASSIALIDPGIKGYLAAGRASFRNGTLRGVPVELLPIGAEQVPPCYLNNTFDTVVQLNVIEHTFNAFATLHIVHSLLKPGGILIFHERIVKLDAHSQIFHPVRLTQRFFDAWLDDNFEELYRSRDKPKTDKVFIAGEIYFIGRRRQPRPL